MSDKVPQAALTMAGLAAGAVFKYAAVAWIAAGNRQRDYEYVGTVKELYVYPIKSLKGLKVDSAKTTTLGLHYGGVGDRYVCIHVLT